MNAKKVGGPVKTRRKSRTRDQSFNLRLQEAYQSLGLTARKAAQKIAQATGDNERKVYDYLLNKRSPKTSDLDRCARSFARALDIDANRLLSDSEGEQFPASAYIPLHADALPKTAPINAIPFPVSADASDYLRLWRVEDGDMSMVGDGYSLTPGSYLIIDTKCTINPGNAVLCQIFGAKRPITRLFKAALEYADASQFTLVSPNPLFEDLVIKKATDCRMIGRITYLINQL